MTSHYKVAGVWKQTVPKINVNSVWKTPKSAYVNCNGSWKSWFLQGGINDNGFANYASNTLFDSTVTEISIQTDGKILIGGRFTTFNGISSNKIIRLNSDGTVDTAFLTNIGTAAGTSVSTSVESICIQSDNKIIVGGSFTDFNGTSVYRIVRLNSDGTRDTAFTTNTGTGAPGIINSIAIQTDGKIIVVGGFTNFNNRTARRIIRLNSDGTIDTAFLDNIYNAANATIYKAVIQLDGKIILVGGFTIFDGTSTVYPSINGIVRLNSNGTTDTSFSTNLGSGTVNLIYEAAIQLDGKIILVGPFTTFSGISINRIVRLNSNGTIDTSFTANVGSGANSTINKAAIQLDGKIILVGDFTTFNGTSVNRIVRLNSDGTVDTSFVANVGSGANNSINEAAIQLDGKILIGGGFTSFNNISRGYITRIGGDVAV
jgi:uncharacterized delta-60 repeat protein